MNLHFHEAPVIRALSIWLLVSAAGCAGRLPSSDIPAAITTATGLDNAVQFSGDAQPLNVEVATDTLTISDAVRLALRHDPGLQAALARVRSASADAKQARLLPNPILSVAVRIPEGGGKPVIEAGLAADLLAVLERPRRASAADARLRAASAAAITTALDLLLEVQTSYTTAQALDAELAVLAERTALVDRLLGLARSRVEAGESSQLDVLTLHSERVTLDVEVSEKTSDLRQQRLDLARKIGQPSGSIAWRLPAPVAPPEWNGKEQAWIASALQHSPDVQAQRWELAALGDEASLGTLDLFEAGVEAERDGDWTIGPSGSVAVPLMDWGQARNEKATAAVIEARHNMVQAQRQVVQEVRQAIESLKTSEAMIQLVQQRLLPLQQRRIEQAEAAYRNGVADITAVLIAEQESQESRQKLIALEQKAATARYRLHRAVGGSAIASAVPAGHPTSLPTTAPTNAPAMEK